MSVNNTASGFELKNFVNNVIGTSNQINAVNSNGTITVGLTDDVTISGKLTVNNYSFPLSLSSNDANKVLTVNSNGNGLEWKSSGIIPIERGGTGGTSKTEAKAALELENVTNESKSTMFNNSSFTGNTSVNNIISGTWNAGPIGNTDPNEGTFTNVTVSKLLPQIEKNYNTPVDNSANGGTDIGEENKAFRKAYIQELFVSGSTIHLGDTIKLSVDNSENTPSFSASVTQTQEDGSKVTVTKNLVELDNGTIPLDSNFIVGDGTKFVLESGDTARTSLGLGITNDVEFGNVALNNSSNRTITIGSNNTARNLYVKAGDTSSTDSNGGHLYVRGGAGNGTGNGGDIRFQVWFKDANNHNDAIVISGTDKSTMLYSTLKWFGDGNPTERKIELVDNKAIGLDMGTSESSFLKFVTTTDSQKIVISKI